jgi:glycosyltransferase involved in cell wall biosynthesis
MFIHYLLTQDLESPSGVGRYWPLAVEMARLGHRVSLSALHGQFTSLTERQFTLDGVEIHYVSQMHVIKQGNEKRYFSAGDLAKVAIQATWRLGRNSLEQPADIIHIGKPHPMNGLAGWLSSRLKNRIFLVDCDDFEAASGHFDRNWYRRGVAFFEKFLPRRADYVTTNTHFMQKNLLDWGVPQEKIFYLPNGVSPERFQPPAEQNVIALRNQLGLEDKPVVAYIGTISLVSHPIHLLLDAFADVLQVIPNAVLLLVGGGEDLETLRNQADRLGITPAVRFTGKVPSAEVKNYYALAEVTVDPVLDDPAARGRSPLKMFESWACGVPFVTASVGDRPYLAGDPPAARLVRPGDAHALGEGILEVLRNPALAQHLSQAGLRRVQEFTWQKLAAEMEQQYLKISRKTGRTIAG